MKHISRLKVFLTTMATTMEDVGVGLIGPSLRPSWAAEMKRMGNLQKVSFAKYHDGEVVTRSLHMALYHMLRF